MGQSRQAHRVLMDALRETNASPSTVKAAEAVIAEREAKQAETEEPTSSD
jgi:hypothetical protein